LSGEWLTYREAAGRLGSNIEAVRQRAIRCRWPRTVGNDKRARIQIPEDLPIPVREGNEGAFQEGNDRASRKGNDGAYDRPLIKALEAHVETLKAQLAAAVARAEGLTAERDAERTQTEKAIAAFAALAERLDALAAERAKPWWRRLAG
jgi:hypothetical protein